MGCAEGCAWTEHILSECEHRLLPSRVTAAGQDYVSLWVSQRLARCRIGARRALGVKEERPHTGRHILDSGRYPARHRECCKTPYDEAGNFRSIPTRFLIKVTTISVETIVLARL